MKASVNKLLIRLYYVVTLVLFAFMNFNGATAFADMTVPYIEGRVVIVHFLFACSSVVIFIILSALNKKRIKVDMITICLITKSILDLVPVFIHNLNMEDYIGFYLCTPISLISYFMFSNIGMSKNDFAFYRRYLLAFGLTLSLQVIYTFVYSGVPYMSLGYKTAMVIPYGGTNIIAAILVPILVFSLMEQYRKGIKILLFCILSAAIVLTKSRGGMIMWLSCIIVLLYLYLGKTRNKTIKRIIITLFIFLTILIVMNFENVRTVFMGYELNTKTLTLNRLTSGRVENLGKMLDYAYKNTLLFGAGMQSIEGNLSGAHNIFIDLIVKGGIVGTMNYVVLVFFLIQKGHRLYKAGQRTLFVMVLVIYINSLFEVNYFTYSADTLLWTIAGIMMSLLYSKDASKWNEKYYQKSELSYSGKKVAGRIFNHGI